MLECRTMTLHQSVDLITRFLNLLLTKNKCWYTWSLSKSNSKPLFQLKRRRWSTIRISRNFLKSTKTKKMLLQTKLVPLLMSSWFLVGSKMPSSRNLIIWLSSRQILKDTSTSGLKEKSSVLILLLQLSPTRIALMTWRKRLKQRSLILQSTLKR